MCYGSFCGFEDSNGECRKPRGDLCPQEYPDGDVRDMRCDQLYEQWRDDARMEAQCSCS